MINAINEFRACNICGSITFDAVITVAVEVELADDVGNNSVDDDDDDDDRNEGDIGKWGMISAKTACGNNNNDDCDNC